MKLRRKYYTLRNRYKKLDVEFDFESYDDFEQWALEKGYTGSEYMCQEDMTKPISRDNLCLSEKPNAGVKVRKTISGHRGIYWWKSRETYIVKHPETKEVLGYRKDLDRAIEYRDKLVKVIKDKEKLGL